MRESRLYLRFFNDSWRVLVFGLVAGIFTAVVWWSFHPLVRVTSWFYYPVSIASERERVLMADQLVFDLRRYFDSKKELFNADTNIVVYKPAPMVVEVQLSSADTEIDVSTFNSNIQSQFPVVMTGQKVADYQLTPNHFVGVGFILVSFFISLLVALLRSYGRYY